MTTEKHPSTQLLERNSNIFTGKILLVNPPELSAVEALLALDPVPELAVSCQNYDLYKQVTVKEVPATFETHHSNEGYFETVVVFLPKSDAEIEMVLAWARLTVPLGGTVVLIGQNNAGIKSAKKTLTEMVGEVTFTDNARHSALYTATRTIEGSAFSLADYWQSYELPAFPTNKEQPPLRIFSLPGVFSHGRLDEGTELLLNNLPAIPPKHNVLDWGCGSGVIGAALASQNPTTQVDLVDVSALALASAEQTVTQNALLNCAVIPSHIFSGITKEYNTIIANPPFHKGHDTHYGDSETFLTEARKHLLDYGHLYIVANSFLHYEQFMESSFGYVKTVFKTNKYKILDTVKTAKVAPGKLKTKKRGHRKNIDETLDDPTLIDGDEFNY